MMNNKLNAGGAESFIGAGYGLSGALILGGELVLPSPLRFIEKISR